MAPEKLFSRSLWPQPFVVVGILVLAVIWAGLIYRAADLDRALRIDGNGRGLLEHYGYWACFFSGPLVLLNTYYAIAYFLRLVRGIDEYLTADAKRADVNEIIRPYVESILLHGRWKYMLFLFCVIGIGIAILDFRPLAAPVDYWGNDVFNAEAYPRSWWVANAYLLTLWGFIYPIGLFTVLHIAISTHLVVTRLMREGMLRLDLLHADKCGGMAKFGTLNLILMLIYGWMAAASVALMVTHQNNYLSLIAGGLGLSILFIVHSFVGIGSVARVIQAQRDQAVGSLNDRIREMMEGRQRSFAAAAVTMQYRDRVMEIATFPYSRGVSVAVNFLRYAPAAVTLANMAIPRSLAS